MITATNEDNMIMMARYPDDYFELAIVDPPYGIGYSGRDGQKSIKYNNKKNWDDIQPSLEYFNELKRVSKNQIIWGANYFTDFIKLGKGIICWWKHQNGNFSQWEMAHTSIGNAKHFDRSYQQDQYNKIHPTQKPVKLYEWLLMNYAKEGDKILDTDRGSASLDIACHNLGFDLVTCEIDTDYFNDGNKRLKQHQNQQVMKF